MPIGCQNIQKRVGTFLTHCVHSATDGDDSSQTYSRISTDERDDPLSAQFTVICCCCCCGGGSSAIVITALPINEVNDRPPAPAPTPTVHHCGGQTKWLSIQLQLLRRQLEAAAFISSWDFTAEVWRRWSLMCNMSSYYNSLKFVGFHYNCNKSL